MQFSTIESRKFHTAWLAWKDINSYSFLETFKPVWNSIVGEVSVLFKKSNYNQNVYEIGKVGLTLDPGVGFAFSPLMEAYRINIWSLFILRSEG